MNLDRNIVIEASAGTGKTYTLVQTILQALFQKNLPMESLVALTFTKKAAGEMKERIAAKLQEIDTAETIHESWRAWGLPLDTLKQRAREALETIDRAAIGTIHSYAFSLLKRFPLQAGISPAAEVDEKGVRSDDLFEQAWPAWLRTQLSTQDSAPRTKEWLEVLSHVQLDQIKKLARRLSDFDVPQNALPLTDEQLKKDLEPFYAEIRTLIVGKPEVNSTYVARACEEVMGIALAGEWEKLENLSKETRDALDATPTKTKDWIAKDVADLKIIRLIALNLLSQGDHTLALLTGLLKPFIQHFRDTLLADGLLSNNALLVLARNLVAKDFHVRETLKQQVRLIFIDEFQDTDPIQGELLLFLAEVVHGQARTGDAVQLEPGKLFIVGDPKQSIYLFRGADISAYGRITRMVLDQGGQRLLLEESYRSHEQIIHAVNAAFAPLIQEKEPISPPYQALVPRRKSEDAERHLVELRLAHSLEPRKSDESLQKEAEDAAQWIATAKAEKRWTYKDIALVFRSSPAMPPFIEQLRALNIPFVVEGERYFFRTPEVTDVLNLLRVLENPENRIALAGFLRSPLGGFDDVELVELQRKNGLELNKPLPQELDGAAHHGAWELLRRLRRRVGREPLKSILHHVYEDTYLLELAARSYHRDQTIANLNKLRRLMELFAEEGETTLGGLLSKIDRFMEADRLEGESPLADETYDAVRLLTIHGAKGLEYPVVWLPGLHRDTGGTPDTTQVTARFDWTTKRLGIRLGKSARNIGDFVLEKEWAAREEAEEARVLYVAMTRARDHLILSGGVCTTGRSKQPASGSFLAQLAGAWQIDLENVPEGELQLGEGVITVRRSPAFANASAGKPDDTWLKGFNLAALAKIWKAREKTFEHDMVTKAVQTPSSAANQQWSANTQDPDGAEQAEPKSVISPRLLGTLVHRFLEHWDFSCEKCDMPAKLRLVANSYFASLGLLKEPFPNPREGDKTNNPPELTQTVEEAQRLLADFIGSEEEEEIKAAEIIGREVPFFYLGNGHEATGNRESSCPLPVAPCPPLMRGFMDILYRTKDGQLVVGDYKTDKEHDDAKYAAQGAAYTEAVFRALGQKAIFKTIYIRQLLSEHMV